MTLGSRYETHPVFIFFCYKILITQCTYGKILDSVSEPPILVHAEDWDVRHLRIVKEVGGPRSDRLGLTLPRTTTRPMVPFHYRWTAAKKGWSIFWTVLLFITKKLVLLCYIIAVTVPAFSIIVFFLITAVFFLRCKIYLRWPQIW